MNTYARFRFHEHVTPFMVGIDEVKNITLNTANGPAVVEIGLKQVQRSEEEVDLHLTPYFRNLGGGMFTLFGGSETDQVVHPKDVSVIFESVGVANTLGHQRFNRHNKVLGAVQVDKKLYGLRDAWCKEPTAIFAGDMTKSGTPDDVVIYCLEDVGPYSPFPAQYQQSINLDNPKSGEDILSVSAHRLRGGMANMWNVVVCDASTPQFITTTVSPKLSDGDTNFIVLKNFAGVADEPKRTKRVRRFEKLIESMTRGDIVQDPDNKIKKAYPWVWYFFRGTDRFQNWNATDGILDVSDKAQNIGWKSFGDLFWSEGHYNLGYDWLLIAARMWLDNPHNQFWWETFVRFAEWQCQQGMCWSGKFRGMQWYEKGKRGNEVGSDYWPSSYKQRTEGLLLAGKIFELTLGDTPWWYKDCLDVYKTSQDSVLSKMFDGNWGERTAGWNIMNAISWFRYTGEDAMQQHAVKQALNYIDLCKLRTHMAIDLPGKWKDGKLGIPFCPNAKSTPKFYTNSWQMAKVAKSFTHILTWGTVSGEVRDIIHEKTIQMAKFLAEECINFDSSIALPIDLISGDLTPAWYRGGYISMNTPRSIEAHLPWFLASIGYAALNNVKSCRDIYTKIVHDAYSYPEPSVEHIVEERYWEGHRSHVSMNSSNDMMITHEGADTSDVVPGKHQVRLQNDNGVQYQCEIKSVTSNTITLIGSNSLLNNEYSHNYYDWIITGPVVDDGHNIRSMSDKAIRKFVSREVNMDGWDEAEFDWNGGMHFNTWFKNIGMILNQWDYPFIVQRLLDVQDERRAASSAPGDV